MYFKGYHLKHVKASNPKEVKPRKDGKYDEDTNQKGSVELNNKTNRKESSEGVSSFLELN